MGGRKSYFLKDVIGTGRKVGQKKAQLTKSFKTADATGVSTASANLVIEHRDMGKILVYSKKLFSHVKGKYAPEDLKIVKDISRRVRVDWAHLKSKANLESNSIINSAVIDNVSRVLKERASNAVS